MPNAARPLLVAALALAPGVLAGCVKPEPPTVKPISGRVASISNQGITVEAKLEAFNPNDFDIKVKSFTAKIVLDDNLDIGTVSSPHAVTLPARKKKQFDVPINVKWNDAAALVPLGLSNRDVPYEATGHVKISAEALDVDLPFRVTGVVTHQQIVQAVGRSIPHVPGLPF
jgi:LEA14-like dessication related protein